MPRTHEAPLPYEVVGDNALDMNGLRAYRIVRLGEEAVAAATDLRLAPCADCEPAAPLTIEQPELPF